MSIDAPRPSGRSPYDGPAPASAPPPRAYTPLWRRLREDEWPPLGEVLRGRRGQISPGVILALAVPCLWWLTVPLLIGYQMARTARLLARRIFPVRPEGVIEDREVLRVQRVRAWVAVVMSVALLAVFGGWKDMADAGSQVTQRMIFAPWVALPSAAVTVALLFWAAGSGARRTMRTKLWPACRSALWFFGAWVLVPLWAVMAFKAMSVASGHLGPLTTPLLLFVCWTPFWWLIFFLGFASGPALRHAFNLSTLHPVLPALVTTVLVWAFALLGLRSGGLPPGPAPLAVCAFLGGPVSVTAVAWWEIHRLRHRHGVRWRG
ncbi:hypothetical protein ACGH2B_20655 [Streptomyces sp. BBFR2]|uniref:hypothetical protein n=1 Tax=Streptomyces sp. BBFR2 TaxID=3372854 RepID=UPI0037D9BDDF